MSIPPRRASRGAPRTVLLPWEGRRAWLTELRAGKRPLAVLAALIVAALIGWALSKADHRAKVRTTRAAIAAAHRGVLAFRAEVGRCPRSLVELVHPPKSGARYVDGTPIDGWGQELLVRCPGRSESAAADVISAGPSGSFAIDDNIL